MGNYRSPILVLLQYLRNLCILKAKDFEQVSLSCFQSPFYRCQIQFETTLQKSTAHFSCTTQNIGHLKIRRTHREFIFIVGYNFGTYVSLPLLSLYISLFLFQSPCFSHPQTPPFISLISSSSLSLLLSPLFFLSI